MPGVVKAYTRESDKGLTMKLTALLATCSIMLLPQSVLADAGDRIEARLDKKADRIENRLDLRGDRINRHL